MKLKIEKFLFHLFIFSIPFQARLILFQWTAGFNEWTTGFLWGTDILFILLLVFRFPKLSKISYALIAFFVFALLSITQAIMPEVAVYRSVKLLEYILFFVYLKQALPVLTMPQNFALAVFLSGTVQAMVGILQIILQHSLGLRLLGESVLELNGRGVAVVVAQSESFLRAYGTMPHPNLLATWLLLSLVCFGWWYVKTKPLVFWLVPGAIMLFGFFATFSRVAILCGGVTALVLLLMTWRRESRALVLCGLVTSVLFLSLFWPQVQSRLSISVADEAVVQRVFYSNIVRDSAVNTFWLGNGIGQFVPVLMKSMPHYPHYIYQPAHSLYFLIFNELGIFGVLVGFIFLVNIIRPLLLPHKAVLILAFGFLSLGLFDHYFWTLQQGGFMLWGFFAVVASADFWYDKV